MRVVATEHTRVHLELHFNETTDVRVGATRVEFRNRVEEGVRERDVVDGAGRVDQKDTFDSNTFLKELARGFKGDDTTKRPT
jgi:hypothetical protein